VKRGEGMKTRRILMMAAALPIALGAMACTWVGLTSEGEAVAVKGAEAVAGCEKLGRTRSRTASSVGIFDRSDDKVLEEQTALARNEAARMGGDVVVVEGEAEGPEQVFGVYRCGTNR